MAKEAIGNKDTGKPLFSCKNKTKQKQNDTVFVLHHIFISGLTVEFSSCESHRRVKSSEAIIHSLADPP